MLSFQFERLSQLPHFVANVEAYFANFNRDKSFLKEAGRFLHLIMFGFDFNEGEGEDDGSDADDQDQASTSSIKRLSSDRRLRTSELRRLFDKIGKFRGITG